MKLLEHLSEEELIRLAWESGRIDYLVREHQEPVWHRMNELVGRTEVTDIRVLSALKMRELVLNLSRRWGKTTLGFLLLTCLCLENEYHTYYFVAPTEKDAKDIISSIAADLFRNCPDDLRPSEVGGEFTFRNGSVIKIGGTWNGARSLRGRAANGVFIDEAAFIPQLSGTSCLSYVLSSVIAPLTLTTKGWTIISSTPPPNMKHDYVSIYRQAEIDNRLIVLDIYDNKSLTLEQIEEEKVKSYSNDPTGSAWKREYLALLVPSTTDLIVPEEIQQNIIYRKYERPEEFDFLHRYIVLDHGTTDLTAVLFCYYDYKNALAVVEKELLVPKRLTTDGIAAALLATKEELWGKLPVFRAVADSISHQLIIDINSKLASHNIVFVHPSKTDLEAMVNQTIIALNNNSVVISDECFRLIDTIKSGTWKTNANSGKREFARLNEIGHCDFLAALIYFVRMLIKNINPYSSIPINMETQFRNPFAETEYSNQHSALIKALSGPQRGITKR